MRRAGILLPLFSLPSSCGIGTMGQAARDFVDFLAEAGQSCWQVLPMGPTSYGDSPYQSYSAFAGNPYFIDLDDLADEGLLEKGDYDTLNWGDPRAVDYGLLYQQRYPILRKACKRLLEDSPADYQDFLRENAVWLDAVTEEDRSYAAAYMRLNEGEGYCLGMCRTVWAGAADLAILQIQDILGLGAESRINTPSTTGQNWKWRLLPGQLTYELAARLHRDMEVYGRLPVDTEA